MTKFLVRTFIKDSENVTDLRVRGKYGTLSSIVGIICNILLFALKYTIGTLSNSISIVSDAFNNLSDGASCIVTLLGYKMAAKPADKNHPFGHGRMEYLVSLIIAAVILVMGLELLQDSFNKVLHPEDVKFSVAALIALIASIGVKLWMSVFNTQLGNKINSSAMLATAKDSRSDVFATAAAALALICSTVTDFPIDGIMGLLVSVLILKAGLEIIKDTVDELLGKPADPELIEKIRGIVCSDERIIGVHDMIIHSYGPGNIIGSCHAEVKSTEDFVAAHDLIDRIEHEIHKKLKIAMTIHMDPIEVDNEQINACRRLLADILSGINDGLKFHDFRTVTGDTHVNLIFDLVVPFEIDYSDDELKSMIDEELSRESTKYYTVITFDRDYT
ncbi:MAG: cation diffusion facilitator family transporter [Ruminococcus sp.]|nr:cation diffusion facilitator family transporter [Ruminococcus sp.]